MVSYASLDKNGNLLAGEPYSKDPHKKQDQASITKLWALHTMIEETGAGWPKFYKENEGDIKRMMTFSDNAAANRLACRVADPDIKEDELKNITRGVGENKYTDKQRAAINKFVERMNHHAGEVLQFKEGQERSTNFATVEGMPRKEHYSTAYDMAKLMYAFEKKHPDKAHLADIEFHGKRGNTGYEVVSHDGVKGFKTGTAMGYHGDWGRSSGIGATENGGTFCAMGVGGFFPFKSSSKARNNLCNQLADQINTGICAEDIGDIRYAKGAGGKGAAPEDVEVIKNVQNALGMKEQTGFYGDKTTAAILDYQKDYNKTHKGKDKLPETGMLDTRTMEVVLNVYTVRTDEKIAIQSPASSAEALAANSKTIVPVANPAQATTQLVAKTEAAKTSTATASAETTEAKPKVEVAATDTKQTQLVKTETVPTQKTSEVAKSEDTAKAAARPLAANFRNNGVYDRGDGGVKGSKQDRDTIAELQKALGMKKELQTGYFGENTELAVQDFKKKYNAENETKLAENGVVDRQTKELILKATDVPKTMVAQVTMPTK